MMPPVHSLPAPPKGSWPKDTQRQLRGHDFYPPDSVAVPPLHATDSIPARDKTVVAHYFTAVGESDWWVVEASKETGMAFCFARINGDEDSAEWGYSSLEELEAIRMGGMVVERDINWSPARVRDVPEMGFKSDHRDDS